MGNAENSAESKPVSVECGVSQPTWEPVEKVMVIVEQAKRCNWQWPLNPECKYIELRIDMRDGYCLIRNREGQPITLAELQRQGG